MDIKVVNENGTIPFYGTEKAAGFDLCCNEDVVLKPFIPTLVHTGLKMQIPEDTELQIRPRSGLALSDGITVLNSPGTVDADYRGEICVILHWNGYHNYDNSKLDAEPPVNGRFKEKYITAGTRIAQAVLGPYYHAEFVVVDSLDDTDRGEGGFGSTGTK